MELFSGRNASKQRLNSTQKLSYNGISSVELELDDPPLKIVYNSI